MHIGNRTIGLDKRLVASLGTLFVLVLSAVLYYQIFVFHMTGTSPSLSAMPTVAPYVRVSFNQALADGKVSVDDPANVVSSTVVKGKDIFLNFGEDLTAQQKYSITLSNIQNKNGKVITSKKLVFTAQNIEYDRLSSELKKVLVNVQDHYPYAVDYVNFVGFSKLTDNGMSAAQLDSVKQAIFNYSEKLDKEYWTVSLVPESVQTRLHDSDTEETTDSQTFTVKLDKNTSIQVVASYDLLSDTVGVQIYDSTGVPVYSSADDPED